MQISLIRRVSFQATHAYRLASLSEAENRARFGKLVEEHEHRFSLEVGVFQKREPCTGFVVDLGLIDEVLEALVTPLEERSLNDSVPSFAKGRTLPSCENLAIWFHGQISAGIPNLEVRWVKVFEDETLGAELRPE